MAVKLLYGQLFLISDALKAWRGSAALARASQLAINRVGVEKVTSIAG